MKCGHGSPYRTECMQQYLHFYIYTCRVDLALNLAVNIVCIKRNTTETWCLKYHITYLGGDETNWASCFSPARNVKGTLNSVALYHIDIKFDYLRACSYIIVIKTDS